ncbi:MAG: LacI family DNA-binding transcriptional regulator [Endozoicomonas sp.]|uniref:LacI family DNA-binding transcriptional regulator n=1 Tax=Endozoicomonas sp. TaxID=1892382 RepID=UPI003D9B21E1
MLERIAGQEDAARIWQNTFFKFVGFEIFEVANIKDVAKLAGVSISTVSRVVNQTAKVADYKQEAVHKAMESLGYRPNSFAKALVSKKSDTLGLVVGDLGDPFFGLLARGVESVAQSRSLQLLISSGHHEPDMEARAISSLMERGCDALIVHSKALHDYQLMDLLSPHAASVVINRKIQGAEGRCIYLDNIEAGELAVKHLLENGHRRVAFLSRDTDIDDLKDRYQGYQNALMQAGIIPDSQLIGTGTPDEQGGYRATMDLLDRDTQFTAVFAYNDAMAAGCLSALSDRRLKVPDDISLIGFDDVHFARFMTPKLTTIHYPIELMGERAAQLALKLGGLPVSSPGELRFEPSLIKRDSVTAS